MAANLNPSDVAIVAADARMNTGPFTLSFLINSNQATANIALLNRHGMPSSNRGMMVMVNNTAGKGTLLGKDTGGTYRVNATGAISFMNSAWHHIAAIFDLTTTANANKLYVDGVLDVQSTAGAAWDIDPAVPFRIGASQDAFWGQFGDLLAEVAWYDAALAADDIVSLAKGFRPSKVRPQKLVSYNPMVRSIIELRGAAMSGSITGGWDPHPRVF